MLLTSKEVCERLQIHRITLYRWITDNGFPAHKIMGRWRFDWDDVQNWIERIEEVAREKPDEVLG